MREETSLPSPPLLFIAIFTSHRSPLSERLEQAKPSRAVKPREIPGRPYSLFLEHGSAAETLIGNLSKDVFERRTSTGSEALSLSLFFSLIKTIYPRI